MSKQIFGALTLMLMFSFITGCGNKGGKTESGNKQEQKTEQNTAGNTEKTTAFDISGNYVSDAYSKRGEGYDWVAVTVKNIKEGEIFISVRSRADRKKPTCTFDTKAFKLSENSYKATVQGKTVLFNFTKDSINIATENKADENVLYFYCSGGATVAGGYAKINEPLDQSQIDKTIFSKNLKFNDLGFYVSTLKKDGKEELIIYPYWLKGKSEDIKQSIEGTVTDAELDDLNRDGYPEVVVYTMSADNKGSVYGISVLAGKSAVPFYFPPVQDNPQISNGYNGFDEFTLIEGTLSQKFPVFQDGKKTGKMRQVNYKIEKGENLPVFKVKNVTDF